MNDGLTSLEMRMLTLLHGVREECDEAARAELNTLLREEAEARKIMPRLLVDEQALVSLLREEGIVALIEREAKPRQSRVPLRSASRWLRWLVPASMAAAIIWGLVLLGGRPAADSQPRDYIATLLRADTTAELRDPMWMAGQRLSAGPLKLEHGSVLVGMDGGAQLAILGPAEVVLESPGSARLVSGQVAVQAPDEAAGFRLATPAGTAVDLGTEFVVSVDHKGVTECRVLSGEVEWHSARPAQKVALLAESEGRRFRGGQVESLPASSLRFQDFVPPAPPAVANVGELLAYEPFDYAEPMMTADRAHGGMGWPSPWRGPLAPEKVEVAPRMEFEPGASLAFGGLAAPRGGSLVFGAQRWFRARALPLPVDFGADGVHYFSFLMRAMPPTAAAGQKPWPMRFALVSSSTHVWVAVSLGTSFRPLILAQGNNNSAGEPLTAGETVFVVCKVVTSRQGADQMFLRVYRSGESIEAGETTHWTVSSRALHFDDVLDHVELAIPRSEGGRFDELRVGTSWAAVVPLTQRPDQLRATN